MRRSAGFMTGRQAFTMPSKGSRPDHIVPSPTPKSKSFKSNFATHMTLSKENTQILKS